MAKRSGDAAFANRKNLTNREIRRFKAASGVSAGSYSLSARVAYGAGSTVASPAVGVVVANASDDYGVAGVQFKLNGANLGSEDTTTSVTVNYSLGGAAVNGTDYETLNTSVTIPAGAASATITVIPQPAASNVGPMAATLLLSANPTYTIGPSGNASVTIAGNSVPSSLRKVPGKNSSRFQPVEPRSPAWGVYPSSPRVVTHY